MTEQSKDNESQKEASRKKGEVGGRGTRLFATCPFCGTRHQIVNDTKGVWICPDCGKPYDPY